MKRARSTIQKRQVCGHSRKPFFVQNSSEHTFFKSAPPANRATAVAHGSISTNQPEKEPNLSASGTGKPTSVTVFGGGQNVTLEGETKGEYDGGSFKTKKIKAKKAVGCEGCEPEECFKITGTLASTFSVKTTVTLPSADDYPDLTKCQKQRVQSAITNKLSPHEQDHVRRFKKYNGSVNTPIDMTICQSEFDAKVQGMHDAVAKDRQDTVQADSDSIDPFNILVDLDCQDKPAGKKQK